MIPRRFEDSIKHTLYQHIEAIAESWYRALLTTTYSPHAPALVRSQLTRLTGQVINSVSQSPVDRVGARSCGSALAMLSFDQPSSLASTLLVLQQQVMNVLDDQQKLTLLPQLIVFCAAFSEGFSIQARETLLMGQEQIRRALVDARVRAQAALYVSESHVRFIVANLPIVIFAISSDGRITTAEGQILNDFKMSPELVVGRSVYNIAASNSTLLEHISRALAGESFSAFLTVGQRFFDINYAPEYNNDQHVIGTIGIAFEVTNRITLEQKVARLSGDRQLPLDE